MYSSILSHYPCKVVFRRADNEFAPTSTQRPYNSVNEFSCVVKWRTIPVLLTYFLWGTVRKVETLELALCGDGWGLRVNVVVPLKAKKWWIHLISKIEKV